ncbi:MAG TPA: RHS repeat-associated core domain-containing protein, partial [Candidatus Binataceae bacterium]|nr:RHS repeat-associated core domain-containing protein [Candidatus Binataceae bacterium]
RQLLSLTPVSGGGNSYGFTYDGAGNRLSETIGAVTKSYTYNSVNALTSPGSAVYDKEGEPLTLGSATYKWDAAHRLISVTSGAKTTRFGYDGFGRRARITQLNGATVTSDKYYFWCRTMPCVEKDAATNAITKRYLTEGVIAGSQFYYARDHLGSIREMVTASGSIGARYDYDPSGARSKLAGAADSDFGFAQLFQDPQSGLELAVFRAYDALSGRWLNRDPIGEAGGSNLYSYVLNNPTILNDPLGLCGLSDSFVSPSLVDAIDSVMRFGGEATASVEQGAGLAAFIFAPEAIRSVETLGLVFTGNGDYEPYDYGSHKSGVHNPVDSIHLNAAGIAISEWSRKTEDSLYRAILDPREYRLSHLKLYPEERPYRPGFHEPGFGGVRQ